MFGKKGKSLEPNDQAGLTGSDMGGVPGESKYFRCLDCSHVWAGEKNSSCPTCGSENVTRCSEIVYDYRMRE